CYLVCHPAHLRPHLRSLSVSRFDLCAQTQLVTRLRLGKSDRSHPALTHTWSFVRGLYCPTDPWRNARDSFAGFHSHSPRKRCIQLTGNSKARLAWRIASSRELFGSDGCRARNGLICSGDNFPNSRPP